MPKKTRRTVTQRGERPAAVRLETTSAFNTERARPSPAATAPQAASKQVDFSKEYHYVIGDLRKMAILAASMLVVLVALSFVIR